MTKRTRIPTVQELAQHARDLAQAFDIALLEEVGLRPHEARAIQLSPKGSSAGQKMVVMTVIVDETSYATALHEIGHCVAPLGFVLDHGGQDMTLVQERAAWEWARHYSLDWTIAMEQCATLALGSYEQMEAANAQQRAVQKEQDARRSGALKGWLKKKVGL